MATENHRRLSFEDYEHLLDIADEEGGYLVVGGPGGDSYEIGKRGRPDRKILRGHEITTFLEHAKWRHQDWINEISSICDGAGLEKGHVVDRVRKLAHQAQKEER